MTLIELIGFVITLIALMIIFFKRVREERALKKNPELYAEKQRQEKEALKKFYKSMHIETFDEEEEELLEEEEEQKERLLLQQRNKQPSRQQSVPPPPQPHHTYTPLQRPQKVAAAYEVIRQSRNSRGMDVVNKLSKKQDMLILKEIFDKPLAMRDPRD